MRYRIGLALMLGFTCCAALAQTYPSRPIRMIVPQAPGSASDNVARIIAAELGPRLGQQIVVDNRPGGALLLGLDITSKSTPDGHTIGYAMIGALAISPNMQSKPLLNVLTELQPIAQTTTGQMLLATGPASPFKSVKDVIAYAKQNPNKLNYASSGNGTPGHVGFELFKFLTGTTITHVPYKGGAAGIVDLMAGRVQVMLESTNSITPFAQSGRVRGLAVSGPKRSTALPDIPTMVEAGVAGYEATTWTGLVAPVGLPKPIVARLNKEVQAMVASPAYAAKVRAIGSEPMSGSTEAFQKFIRAESAKWAGVIQRSGAKIN